MVSNIYWCDAVEECFTAEEPLAALGKFLRKNVTALKDLIGLVRGKLTSIMRKVRVGGLHVLCCSHVHVWCEG